MLGKLSPYWFEPAWTLNRSHPVWYLLCALCSVKGPERASESLEVAQEVDNRERTGS